MGYRSFLLNGPPSSRDRVTEKLRRKGQSLHSKDEKDPEMQWLAPRPRVSEQQELVLLISS